MSKDKFQETKTKKCRRINTFDEKDYKFILTQMLKDCFELEVNSNDNLSVTTEAINKTEWDYLKAWCGGFRNGYQLS